MRSVVAADVPARSQTQTFLTLLGYVVAAATLLLPLLYSSGSDGFRLPKELALRAEAIVAAGVILSALLAWRRSNALALRLPRALAIAIAAIAAWTIITTLFSTNPTLSLYAISYFAAALVVFYAAYVASASRGLTWLLWPIAGAGVINAVVAVLQATSIADPLKLDPAIAVHLRTTGLLGNPNDVGSYLMPVSLLLVCAAVATRRRYWWGAAAITALGLLASGALTSMIALGAALITLALLVSPKKGWMIVGLLVGAAALLVLLLPPLRQRATLMRDALARRDYPALTSYRIYSVATAWEMFKDRPLSGVGPGVFKFQYLPYRKDFDERHPQWYLQRGPTENYGEAHCDHVQILAEEGLPGYALFLAALIFVGRSSFGFPCPPRDERERFARLAGLPLAVGFAVLALAAFPLELAAVTQLVATAAAATLRWRWDS